MCSCPSDGPETDNDQKRGRPNRQFEMRRMVPLRIVGGVLAVLAVAPREKRGRNNHRDNDQKHEPGRDVEEIPLLRGNVARWVQHDGVAAAEQKKERREGKEAKTAQGRSNQRDDVACMLFLAASQQMDYVAFVKSAHDELQGGIVVGNVKVPCDSIDEEHIPL